MSYAAKIEVGKAVELGERLTRITAPNPGAMTGPGTNTYIVGRLAPDGEVIVVDPGPAIESHIQAIQGCIEHSGATLKAILVTHTHRDHSPAAADLKQRYADSAMDIPCMGLPTEKADEKQFQDESFSPDRVLEDGDILSFEDFSVETIYTPGHVSNHLCFLLSEDQVLLAGDHMMQGSTVAIVPPQGDMLDYLSSLEKLKKDYSINAIAPAHGTILDEPSREIDKVIRHRMWREGKVVEKLPSSTGISTNELLVLVYDDVNPDLHWAAKFSLFAHLHKLLREQRVSCDTDLSGLNLETIEKLDSARWQLLEA